MKFKATVMSLVLACSMTIEAKRCESSLSGVGDIIFHSMTKWERLKASTVCDLDQGRMQDIQLKNAGSNGDLIEGSYEGRVLKSYYGQTGNGDLIKVSKIQDEEGKVSYNVSLAMCRYSDQFATYIGEEAGMSDFQVNQINFQDNERISGWFSLHTDAIGEIPLMFSGVDKEFVLITSEDDCGKDLGQGESFEDDNIVSSGRGKQIKEIGEEHEYIEPSVGSAQAI